MTARTTIKRKNAVAVGLSVEFRRLAATRPTYEASASWKRNPGALNREAEATTIPRSTTPAQRAELIWNDATWRQAIN